MGFFENFYEHLHGCLHSLDFAKLEQVTEVLRQVQNQDKKVIVAGNGGSAAMASHVSVDLTKAAGVRAMCFSDADLITCFANDFGYEFWVEKAIEYYAQPQDVAILISSSGKSPNIINGALKAKEMGLTVVTLSGFEPDNPLRRVGDYNLYAPSRAYNVIETSHQTWLLSIVDRLVGQMEYSARKGAVIPQRSMEASS